MTVVPRHLSLGGLPKVRPDISALGFPDHFFDGVCGGPLRREALLLLRDADILLQLQVD